MSKESDTYKKYFDDVSTNLFNVFALIDEQEEEIELLKQKQEKLASTLLKLIKEFVPDEATRRKYRKQAGIIA